MRNWFFGKVSFSLASVSTKISSLPLTIPTKASSLFLNELILRCATINLLTLESRMFFNFVRSLASSSPLTSLNSSKLGIGDSTEIFLPQMVEGISGVAISFIVGVLLHMEILSRGNKDSFVFPSLFNNDTIGVAWLCTLGDVCDNPSSSELSSSDYWLEINWNNHYIKMY